MKNIFLKRSSALVLSVFLLSGCSTIFGRHQDEQLVFFDSNLQEVEVTCSGKRVVTPGSVPLRQSKSHSCTAEKEGYEKKVFQIRSGVSWSGFGHSTATNTGAWGWWTLGIGTGIGWLVDLPSGAMKNLKEDTIYLEMRPLQQKNVAKKVIGKTLEATKTLVTVPVDTVRATTETVIETAVAEPVRQITGIEATEEEDTEPEPEKPKKEAKVI